MQTHRVNGLAVLGSCFRLLQISLFIALITECNNLFSRQADDMSNLVSSMTVTHKLFYLMLNVIRLHCFKPILYFSG